MSVKELARLNRISARGELRKGQTVKVPQTVRASRGRHGRVGRYETVPIVRSRHHGSSKSLSSKSHSSRGHSSRRHRR